MDNNTKNMPSQNSDPLSDKKISNFAKMLFELMEGKFGSATALADVCNISATTMWRSINGLRKPSVEELVCIRNALALSEKEYNLIFDAVYPAAKLSKIYNNDPSTNKTLPEFNLFLHENGEKPLLFRPDDE